MNIAREIRKATVNVCVYGSPWVHNRVYPEGEGKMPDPAMPNRG